MAASNYQDVDDFLKFSMTTADPTQEEIPDILLEVDRKYKEGKQLENEVRQDFEKQKQSHDDQQGTIPPLGIAKPELVDIVLNNMGNEREIMSSLEEAQRYEKESPWESISREGAGYAARAAEGFFGGIGQFLNLLTPELYESEEGMPFGPGEQPKGFPGPHELRELTKQKTGKYLEPKGEVQKAGQEIFSDIGSMFSLPALGPVANAALPIVGQAGKQLLKFSGATESQQDIGKLGLMTIASIANLGNARGISAQAMNQARDMIPTTLEIAAGPTQKALGSIKNLPWFKTGSTPSKAPAIQMMDRIENTISQKGTLNLQEAMQLRKDLNEARKGLGAFNIPPITDKKSARHYLDQVDKALLQSMENYGSKVNPRWWNNYNLANQAYGITERTGKMADIIEKYAKPLQSDMAKVLFHTGGAGLVTAAGLPGSLGALSGAAGLGVIAGQTYKIIDRMVRSPLLRQHYVEVLKATGTGNAAVINKALQKFDKVALKHEYPKEKVQ